jgi:capsular exopolysaccharide synthesis family protein
LTTSYSRKVLLIDADLRRPSLHVLFRIPVTSGLSEGLEGASTTRVSAVQLSPLLALLPAGRPVENPVPLLTSERMAALIRDARQHFDWVIVDTPPVGLLTDANLLTKESDTTLLVIHANRTPYALVQKAIQAVGKAKIFGVVMNRLEEQIHLTGSTYTGYSGYYRDYLKGGK